MTIYDGSYWVIWLLNVLQSVSLYELFLRWRSLSWEMGPLKNMYLSKTFWGSEGHFIILCNSTIRLHWLSILNKVPGIPWMPYCPSLVSAWEFSCPSSAWETKCLQCLYALSVQLLFECPIASNARVPGALWVLFECTSALRVSRYNCSEGFLKVFYQIALFMYWNILIYFSLPRHIFHKPKIKEINKLTKTLWCFKYSFIRHFRGRFSVQL